MHRLKQNQHERSSVYLAAAAAATVVVAAVAAVLAVVADSVVVVVAVTLAAAAVAAAGGVVTLELVLHSLTGNRLSTNHPTEGSHNLGCSWMGFVSAGGHFRCDTVALQLAPWSH